MCRHRRVEYSLGPAEFYLFRRWRRRQVFVKPLGLCLGDMMIGERSYGHALLSAERPMNQQLISDPKPPVGLRRLSVHVDFAASTRLLRLRPRAI